MAKIIQFPVKESNGYHNLKGLISLTTSAQELNFYMDMIQKMEDNGALFDGEAQKLTEQGRSKRLEMAKPQPIPAEIADKAGVYRYTPEMGGQRPVCQMEASRSHDGRHWFIDTLIDLKGRGISFLKKYEAKDFINGDQNRKCGWNGYMVTERAFEKLKAQYTISQECLLD